ncbi:MAG: hypothetical protein EA414_08435 [Arthrospira sp. PLM2.Bin9]|nr:hypothetical protein [Arthrospira sp. PLM2.Bin9]TVU54128.1 MAG: hypothetical protein EA414_08435 [Arthrospira sp. PLM2.Bin9]
MKSMLMVYLTALIITVIVSILVIIYKPILRYRTLKDIKHNYNYRQPNQCIVGFIPQHKIEEITMITNLETIPGVLQYGKQKIICLMRYEDDYRPITREFDQDTEVVLMNPKVLISSKIPPLIRIINPQQNRSYYFVVTDIWGNIDRRKTREVFNELSANFQGEIISYGQPKRELKIFVQSLTVVMVIGLVTAIYSGFNAAYPQKLGFISASSNGDILTTDHRYLYDLDSQGNLHNKYALKNLGIREGITDLQVSDRSQLFIGNWETGRIEFCQLDQNTCQELPGFQKGTEINWEFRSTFKFVVDHDKQLIYATDTARHRLVALTMNGEIVESTRGEEMLLCYPNGITIDNNGKLAVADSNNFRLITWLTNSEGLEITPDQQIDTVRPPRPITECIPDHTTRPKNWIIRSWEKLLRDHTNYYIEGRRIPLSVADRGKTFPIFLEQDNQGFWWVLVSESSFSRYNLIRFDPNWSRPQRVQLPETTDISNMTIAENQVLLTVPESGEIWAIALDDLSVSVFGDDTFKQLMSEIQQSKQNLLRVYYQSLMLTIISCAIVLLIYLWESHQKAMELLGLHQNLTRYYRYRVK